MFIEARTAADDDKPTSNPFNLPEGTVYYLIHSAAIDTGSTSGGGGVNVDKIDNKYVTFDSKKYGEGFVKNYKKHKGGVFGF